MRGRHRTQKDRGTVLIEALIAAAIVAVMLGGLFTAMSSGAARHRMSESRRIALLIAQSELAAAGHDLALVPGRTAREEGGYVAEIDVAPYAGGMADSAAGPLVQVAVRVRAADDTRTLATLSTLKLAGAAR